MYFAPCIAKKAEMKEKDLVGSIDFVVNFTELAEIFKALEINVSPCLQTKGSGFLCRKALCHTGG